MPERRAIVEEKKLHYKGIFSTSEMYELIEAWFADNGFSEREEVEHMEKITKSHKTVEILYYPVKKLSSYSKAEVRMMIEIDNLKRSVVEVDGRKLTMSEGDLTITFDGFLVTDFDGRYDILEPKYFVWRTFFDKLLKKSESSEDEAKVASYVSEIYNHLRDYFRNAK